MTTAEKVLAELQRFNLKNKGNGNYQCNSPFRVGSDSMGFSVKIEPDGEHGAWRDFVSNESGSLYDLAKRLGLDVENAIYVATTKRSYTGLADYANAHGVPEQVFTLAQWTADKKNNRPALRFPTQTGFRWRFLDGLKPSFISENSYKRCWYGLNEKTRNLLSLGENLVICNGEPSVVVAHAYGIPAVCVTGGEVSGIPKDLLPQLQDFLKTFPSAEIVVAMDCDETGRKNAATVVSQLTSAGLNAYSVDLGLTRGGDVADFLTLYGWDKDGEAIAAFKMLPKITKKVPPTPYGLSPSQVVASGLGWVTIRGATIHSLPPIRWLFKGEIPERALTVLFGPSGTGKSFLAVDYCMRVCQTDNALYIAAEGELGYNYRIKAWLAYHGGHERNLFMTLGAVQMMDDNQLTLFIDSHKPIKPKLVIVDTLARSMSGGDENSTRDMNKLMANCHRLTVELECAVLLVHHTGKAGSLERGSSVLRGAADSMIRLSDLDDCIAIECAKSKDIDPFETRYVAKHLVTLDESDEEGNRIITPVLIPHERKDDNEHLTKRQRTILEALARPIFVDGATIAEICDFTQIDRVTVWRALDKFKGNQWVEQTAPREPYRITDGGKRMVDVADVADVAVVSGNYNATKTPLKNQKTTATSATSATTEMFESNRYHREGL